MYFARTAQKLREQMVRFSGTFRGAAEGGPAFRGRGGLWNPGPGLCPVDGSGPVAGRADLVEEDRGGGCAVNWGGEDWIAGSSGG